MERIAETPLEYLISGAVGGFLGTLVGHPFDTVKVRLQTLPLLYEKRQKPNQVVKAILRHEGVTGLYHGLQSPALTIIPVSAICFWSYKLCKLAIAPPEHERIEAKHYFISGCVAGLWTGCAQAPGDRIKVILQIQRLEGGRKYAGATDAIRLLYKEGGLKSIFKGLGATVMKEVPGNGVYFASYELLRDAMTDRGREPTTPAIAMTSGAVAGIAYAVATIPMDVPKNRVQGARGGEYRKGLRDAIPELFRSEGLKGFTRGLGPGLLRAVPANAACFAGFEMARQHIRGQGWWLGGKT